MKCRLLKPDEYDWIAFLNLHPKLGSCNLSDTSQFWIFMVTTQHIEQSFRDFAALVPNDNQLFVQKELIWDDLHGTYTVNQEADFYSDRLKIEGDTMFFDFS